MGSCGSKTPVQTRESPATSQQEEEQPDFNQARAKNNGRIKKDESPALFCSPDPELPNEKVTGRAPERMVSLEPTEDGVNPEAPIQPRQESRQRSLVKPPSPQRRRLTVSTVDVDEAEVFKEIKDASREASFSAIIMEAADGKRTDGKKPKDFAVPAKIPGQPLRSKIKHFAEPSLELLNEKTGSIKDVTVDMIMDLVSGCDSTYMVFGSDADGTQRGFDNKRKTVAGTLAGKWDPSGKGIGYACKKGLKPESPNQDDFFFMRVDDWIFCGVFDGHGPCGHEVSSFVHRALPFLVIGDLMFESDPCSVMRKAFRKTHQLVEVLSKSPHSGIDSTLSGTTATLILYRDNKLFVGHVGDSRGVMASKGANDGAEALDLTLDHKPMQEVERKRIEAAGGEVRQLEGDIPHRVFVKHRLYPGLAMSRAIGDSIGAAVGVVPDPDVRVVDLTPSGVEQFVIVASDGVWEFISSQEAVDYVCQKGKEDVQKAADFVAYEAWRRWVEEEENIVDDVTCIVFWVNDRGPLLGASTREKKDEGDKKSTGNVASQQK